MQTPFLTPGSKVAIVSSARKVEESFIKEAIHFIENQGYEAVLGEHLYAEDRQFAGTDKQRAQDLQTAIDQEDIDMIWFARGGYGSIRVWGLVDYLPLKNNPKLICGYSDITVWHLQWLKLNIPSIHGTMPVNLSSNSEACLAATQKVWKGELDPVQWESHHFNQPGRAEGILVGGNLSMLYSLTGTPLMDLPKNCILFLEDLDEYLYHVDRMMQNLKFSEVYEKLSGIIIGGMSDMNDNAIPFGKTAEEILQDNFSDLEIPIAFGFPAGHCDHNMPLLMNVPIILDVKAETSSLTYVS